MKVWWILLPVALWWLWPAAERTHPPGQLAPAEPLQAPPSSKAAFAHGDFQITPLADFEITARVLARENYYFDSESELAKTDLALGWGVMSDSQVIDALEISQSGRWYRWRTEQLPVPRRQIETSSANMHIIPANDWVADDLADVRKGDVVEIRGHLVRADGASGWRWVSSLTRNDTGDGACEVVYARELRIVTPNH
jgi:hypothetical protein